MTRKTALEISRALTGDIYPLPGSEFKWGIQEYIQSKLGLTGPVLGGSSIVPLKYIYVYGHTHQMESELADTEMMKPDLKAIDIAVETSPALDDQNLRRLTDANESLWAQYEANKTQLAEEQRTTDDYVRRLREVEKQRDALLYTFKEMKQSNEQLTELLEDKKTGQLLMFQTLYGAVRESFEDSVVIAFETDDDIVEHTYERDQFLNGDLPLEEEKVKVCFYLSYTGEVQGPVPEGTIETEDDLIDLRVHRKNRIEGPDTF